MNIKKRWVGKMLCCIFFLFFFTPHYAQDSAKTALKKVAGDFFLNKDYAHALPLYRELLNLYPRDPFYQYHTAFCLLFLNQNLEEVIDLMRVASTDKENPLATFYLGRAYHLHYDFKDAINAYSRFLTLGKKSEIRRQNVPRLIEMAKNGSDITRKAKSFVVKNSAITPTYQLENAYSIDTNGSVIRKPVEFNTKYDHRMNFSSLMYMPAYPEVNEFIYASGYDETGKKGKEIFSIRNINPRTWSLPEPLSEAINTASDEDFPFFDTRSFTLYFSSEGHSSMGGYDLFKSDYDRNTKTWSKPENLGFPINSPYDDFMLVMDDLNQTAQFASNRSTGPGMVTLYRIVMKENEPGVELLTIDDIRELSTLPVSPEITKIQEFQPVDIEYVSSDPDADAEKKRTPPFNKNEYNLVIAEALSLQIRADSLSRISRDQRIMLREIPDNEAKKQLISDMLSTEREAKEIQHEADEKFLEARKMKNIGDTLSENDTNLVLHKEINGIKIYQYKVQNNSPDHSDESTVIIKAETVPGNVKDPDAGNKLEILENSSYSGNNLIPSLPSEASGLVYRIQLGVFSKPKEIDAFGGLYPLFAEWLADKNVYKYYTGRFTSSESVSSGLEKVRNNGFPDAFIVAFFDAKPITTEKAREIEFAGLKL